MASWTVACAALATAGASSSAMWSIARAPNEIRYCVISQLRCPGGVLDRVLKPRRTARLGCAVAEQSRGEGEDHLQFMTAPSGQVGKEGRRVFERDNRCHEVLADRLAVCAQQVDRLCGEPLPVPGVGKAPGYPADLGAPHPQAVVMEFGAEPQFGGSALVEGQVDNGRLGPRQP